MTPSSIATTKANSNDSVNQICWMYNTVMHNSSADLTCFYRSMQLWNLLKIHPYIDDDESTFDVINPEYSLSNLNNNHTVLIEFETKMPLIIISCVVYGIVVEDHYEHIKSHKSTIRKIFVNCQPHHISLVVQKIWDILFYFGFKGVYSQTPFQVLYSLMNDGHNSSSLIKSMNFSSKSSTLIKFEKLLALYSLSIHSIFIDPKILVHFTEQQFFQKSTSTVIDNDPSLFQIVMDVLQFFRSFDENELILGFERDTIISDFERVHAKFSLPFPSDAPVLIHQIFAKVFPESVTEINYVQKRPTFSNEIGKGVYSRVYNLNSEDLCGLGFDQQQKLVYKRMKFSLFLVNETLREMLIMTNIEFHPNLIQTTNIFYFNCDKGVNIDFVFPKYCNSLFHVVTNPLTKAITESAQNHTLIAKQIIGAIEHLHKHGIIHRDVSTTNILVDLSNMDEPRFILSDLGLSRAINIHDDNAELYSINYRSPRLLESDVYKRKTYCSQKDDIWAYGLVLYFFEKHIHFVDHTKHHTAILVLTALNKSNKHGQLNFNAVNGGEIRNKLFQKIMDSALCFSDSNRATAQEISKIIHNFQDHDEIDFQQIDKINSKKRKREDSTSTKDVDQKLIE